MRYVPADPRVEVLVDGSSVGRTRRVDVRSGRGVRVTGATSGDLVNVTVRDEDWVTVAASGADYTSIKTAIETEYTNGRRLIALRVTPGTYTDTGSFSGTYTDALLVIVPASESGAVVWVTAALPNVYRVMLRRVTVRVSASVTWTFTSGEFVGCTFDSTTSSLTLLFNGSNILFWDCDFLVRYQMYHYAYVYGENCRFQNAYTSGTYPYLNGTWVNPYFHPGVYVWVYGNLQVVHGMASNSSPAYVRLHPSLTDYRAVHLTVTDGKWDIDAANARVECVRTALSSAVSEITVAGDATSLSGTAGTVTVSGSRCRVSVVTTSSMTVSGSQNVIQLVGPTSGTALSLFAASSNNVVLLNRGATFSDAGTNNLVNFANANAFGSPAALVTAGTAADGTATTYARSDHRHAIPSTLDTNARVGVRRNSGGSTYTRRRVNLIEGSGVTISLADDSSDEEVDVTISASGSGVTYGSPESLAVGDSTSSGTSTDVPRADHKHGVPVGAPVALATDGTAADGTATTFARSDHRHAIPSTLDTNARVQVRLNGTTIGTRRAMNLIADHGIELAVIDDSANEKVDVTIGSGTVVLDVFTASGTWSKPAHARWVMGWVVGAGGGGGGGRIGGASTNRCGGGGGSGGQLLHFTGSAGAFASSVPVTIGAGGTGGPGGTGTSSNGTAGSDGGNSSFGSITAQGGAGGAGGTNSTSASGGAGRTGLSPFTVLFTSNGGLGTNGTGSNSGNYGHLVPAAGGGGAGRNSSDVAGTAGGNGGGTGIPSGTATLLPGFGVNATVGPTGIGESGANGTNPTLPWPGSGGAGGMCGDATTPGGNGGTGGRAAGGGGGGATTNGAGNAGNGGDGGDGYVYIVTWTGV